MAPESHEALSRRLHGSFDRDESAVDDWNTILRKARRVRLRRGLIATSAAIIAAGFVASVDIQGDRGSTVVAGGDDQTRQTRLPPSRPREGQAGSAGSEIVGTLEDGTPWRVWMPSTGMICARISKEDLGCDAISPTPGGHGVRVAITQDPYRRALVYSTLPESATAAVLVIEGRTSVRSEISADGRVYVAEVPAPYSDDSHPSSRDLLFDAGEIVFLDSDGKEVSRVGLGGP